MCSHYCRLLLSKVNKSQQTVRDGKSILKKDSGGGKAGRWLPCDIWDYLSMPCNISDWTSTLTYWVYLSSSITLHQIYFLLSGNSPQPSLIHRVQRRRHFSRQRKYWFSSVAWYRRNIHRNVHEASIESHIDGDNCFLLQWVWVEIIDAHKFQHTFNRFKVRQRRSLHVVSVLRCPSGERSHQGKNVDGKRDSLHLHEPDISHTWRWISSAAGEIACERR